MTSREDETDEEYSDDLIKLIDYEQRRINRMQIKPNDCKPQSLPHDLTDSGVDIISDPTPVVISKEVRLMLPRSFFGICKNVRFLNKCRPCSVKVIDCNKHSWYYNKIKKCTERKTTDSDIINVDDDINVQSVENLSESNAQDIDDCIIISDSEKEDVDMYLDARKVKPKIRPVDVSSYVRNDRLNVNIKHYVQQTPVTKVCVKKGKAKYTSLNIDFKKNQGLIGLKIMQMDIVGKTTASKVVKDRSDEPTDKTNKKEKLCKRKASGHMKVMSNNSKIFGCKSTEKNVTVPDNILNTSNDKNSSVNNVSDKKSKSNKNSNNKNQETRRYSKVSDEDTSLRNDMQKNNRNTLSSETNKTDIKPNNKEKHCVSKYFKDVWDKDLRMAVQGIDLNHKLNLFKEKLKNTKRKNHKESIKCAKIDKVDKYSKELKKTIKERSSNKHGEIVPDLSVSPNTENVSTNKKSMPSLSINEPIAPVKSQTKNDISSKELFKKLHKNLSAKEKSGIKQQVANLNANLKMLNKKDNTINNQNTYKDSSKLFNKNKLVTESKKEKKEEINKNNKKTTCIASNTIAQQPYQSVIDIDDHKTKSTTVGKQLNSGVIYKDKPLTPLPTAVNKQINTGMSKSKPIVTLKIIDKNCSQGSIQKQNENENVTTHVRKSTPAKLAFYLSSCPKTSPVGDDYSLKHSVNPQETVLNYVSRNVEVPCSLKKDNVSMVDNPTVITTPAIAPANSQEIPNEQINKALESPVKTVSNNAENDLIKNRSDSFTQAVPQIRALIPNNSMSTIPSVKTEDSSDSTNNIKKEDLPEFNDTPMNAPVANNQLSHQGRIYQDNSFASYPKETISTENQQIEPDINLIPKQDNLPQSDLMRMKPTATECLLIPNVIVNTSETAINPTQQTPCQGGNNQMYKYPIQAFVTNRNHHHNVGFAPHRNVKTSENLNNIPRTIIRCAPIYNRPPQNMPYNNQNKMFWFNRPQIRPQISHPQRQSFLSPNHMPHPQRMSYPSQRMTNSLPQMYAQSSLSHPQPQMSHPPQMFNTSVHHHQMANLTPQMSNPALQWSLSQQQTLDSPQMYPQQQMSNPALQKSQLQLSNSPPLMSYPSLQMANLSPQMLNPALQNLQPQQQMSNPALQKSQLQISNSPPLMSYPSQQMVNLPPQMSNPALQMVPNSPNVSYPLQQMAQMSQMSNFAEQKSQLQPQITSPQRQISNSSTQMQSQSQMSHPQLQMSHSQQQMSQSRQQMSHPRKQMSHSQLQMSRLQPQMSHSSQQMSHPQQQMSQVQPEISNPSLKLSEPHYGMSHPSPQMLYTQTHIPNPPSQLLNTKLSIKCDHAPSRSVTGSTIIGRNTSGVVRKINIIASKASGLPSPPVVESNSEDVTLVTSKKEMLEELSKVTTLESSMKEGTLKRPLPRDDLSDTTPIRKPKIGPLSKKFNCSKQDLNSNLKRALPTLNNGYSPPILPIATFEQTFEILAEANIELFDKGNFGPHIELGKPIMNNKAGLRKRRHLSFDDRQDKRAKRISIDEYKKRSTKMDEKGTAIDKTFAGQNAEQDLGYDSDSTVKL